MCLSLDGGWVYLQLGLRRGDCKSRLAGVWNPLARVKPPLPALAAASLSPHQKVQRRSGTICVQVAGLAPTVRVEVRSARKVDRMLGASSTAMLSAAMLLLQNDRGTREFALRPDAREARGLAGRPRGGANGDGSAYPSDSRPSKP